jgi:hypothetical protein
LTLKLRLDSAIGTKYGTNVPLEVLEIAMQRIMRASAVLLKGFELWVKEREMLQLSRQGLSCWRGTFSVVGEKPMQYAVKLRYKKDGIKKYKDYKKKC